MKEMGIRTQTRRKFVITTDSKHRNAIAENHLNRAFNSEEIGKVSNNADVRFIPIGII